MKNDELIGQRFKSNQCGWFTVLDKVQPVKYKYKYLVEFDEVNGVKYSTLTERKHILNGGIKNPYYPLKLGVACVGNVNSKEYKKEFNKWRAMIERCYDEKNNHYNTYGNKGVKVCDRWLCFEYFLLDLPKLEGYDYEKLQNGELHLDKDIIGNSMLYSLENCILTSPNENMKEMNKRIKQSTMVAIHVESGERIVFDNQIEFAKKLGVNQSSISYCLNGKLKTVCGYEIKLLEEC